MYGVLKFEQKLLKDFSICRFMRACIILFIDFMSNTKIPVKHKHVLLLSFIFYVWIRENFRLWAFHGFTCSRIPWISFHCFYKMSVCLYVALILCPCNSLMNGIGLVRVFQCNLQAPLSVNDRHILFIGVVSFSETMPLEVMTYEVLKKNAEFWKKKVNGYFSR